MIDGSKIKWPMLMTILTVLLLVIIPLTVSAEPTQEQAAIESCSTVSAELKGIAIRKVDGKNIRSNITMVLNLELGEKQGNIRPIKSGQGTVTLDGTSYEVVEANGVIRLRRNVALLKLSCEGADSVTIILELRARYFWMGGNLYAVRGLGTLYGDESMRIVFRGKANIS